MTTRPRLQLPLGDADTKQVSVTRSIRCLRQEQGFTLIEVMAAMLILLVGVIATVTLIDGANATTSATKGREGQTNLGRELLEAARSVDYDKVTEGLLPGELQAKPGVADADGSLSGWQIRRRGILYTVTAKVCTFDDATDNGASHDTSFCAATAIDSSRPADPNPDDYRRVTFELAWTSRGRPASGSQTGVIVNPSGGLGPRITSFDPFVPASLSITSASTTQPSYKVTSTPAASVRWSADDGSSDGLASGGPTNWGFTWDLKPVGTFSCSSAPPWRQDGNYLLSAQAYDSRGVPGDLKTKTITIDRSSPAPPCGLAGGRNAGIVDLQWRANPERDIRGYEVFRVKSGSEPTDPRVCKTTRTSCYDPSPPAGDLSYYVAALDTSNRTSSAVLSIPNTANSAPTPPGSLSGSIVDGLPKLTWTAASDPDGTVAFYRVYRDGNTLADRYDVTAGPELAYTDKGAAGHSYWVTAVDNRFKESLPAGPVTP